MITDIRAFKSLLDDFERSLENRSSLLLITSDTLDSILKLYSTAWNFFWIGFDTKNADRHYWYEIEAGLETTIGKIGERFIGTSESRNYSFTEFVLRKFEKHVDAHKKDFVSVSNKKRSYCADVLRIFYRLLFNYGKVADISDTEYFWQEFPDAWRITKSNLQSSDNLAPVVSLKEFYSWSMKRIEEPEGDLDRQLNDVISNLFPDVNVEMWSRILIFLFSRNFSGNRVESAIGRPWNFGYDFKVMVTTFSGEHPEEIAFEQIEQVKAETLQNTFELAFFLFKQNFSKDKILKYLEQAKAITYAQNSTEYRRRQKLIEMLEGLQTYGEKVGVFNTNGP